MLTWTRNTRPSASTRYLPLICLLLALAAPAVGIANPGKTPTAGLQGDIKVMPGVIHATKAQNDVGDDNERIDSLDQSASSETEVIPIVLWNLGYTFDNLKTSLYAGTPTSNIVKGTYFLEIGASHRLDNGTTLSLSWIPELPLIDDEVWKDPFLTGVDREETDRTSQGFQAKAEDIFGSPFFVSYAFAVNDIDEEESGQGYTDGDGNPLTDEELLSLRRSSEVHFVETGFRLPVSRSIILGATLDALHNEADGKAHRFDQLGGKVSMIFRHPVFQAFSTVSYHRADFDGTHPVFDKKREDRLYSASLGIEAPLPFDRLDLAFSMLVRYGRTDSNIDFYEGDTIMGGMGVSYRF
ncbi:DUF2860 family protein [Desulfoluna spongiiphila]|uniref:Uncharacterized protein n=1 Tax=Desulfoluna spongiiphila TaxID=419481 RepID=A0A1G5AFK5_9BACT|nr:DUF2860 family protein [Desulfoluna spongiiphila]SCX76666.1 Protein of unknown function [Desulfoluna spongiiphila]VVS90631.1 protein of unknown function duf2860 [Desulfoluna spongiiphila]